MIWMAGQQQPAMAQPMNAMPQTTMGYQQGYAGAQQHPDQGLAHAQQHMQPQLMQQQQQQQMQAQVK